MGERWFPLLNPKIVLLLLIFIYFADTNWFTVTPERIYLTMYRDDISNNISVKVGRSKRRSPYSINISFFNYYECSRNYTFTLELFEFRSNEYKPSVVNVTYNLCDYLKSGWFKDIVLQSINVKSCPVPRGYVIVRNLFMNSSFYLPHNMPFTKSRMDLKFFHTYDHTIISHLQAYVTISALKKRKIPRHLSPI